MKDAEVIEIFKSLHNGTRSAPAAVDALVSLGMDRADAEEMIAIEIGESKGDVEE